jgi:hypothetical protein
VFSFGGTGQATRPTGLTSDTSLTDVSDQSPGQEYLLVINDKNEVDDWRRSLINYLQDPSSSVDRKFRR